MYETKSIARKRVVGGGLHPVALVQEQLVREEREHPLQKAEPQPPLGYWPDRRYLWDLVARIWSDEARSLWKYGLTEKQYFRLKAQVELAVFGMKFENSRWASYTI